MSDYVDNFILDHEEYFKNNEEYLKTSGWDLMKYAKESNENHESVNEYTQKNKISEMKSDYKLVKSTLDRLSVFIKESAGDRHLAKTQKFILSTASIIRIFLDRCDSYLKKNKAKDLELQYVKEFEIEFQDILFNLKVSIGDVLSKLNIEDATENIKIEFYRDKKATLPFTEILPGLSTDVRVKTENLSFEWNVLTSNEMLINMKPSNIPQWNHLKHYWEQDSVVLQFWQEERVKMTSGLTIGGYFVHPWLYWHLNIFKNKIPQDDGSEPVINPYFRDNEWFFIENLKEAERLGDRGLLMYGTRRMAKSVLMASYLTWKAYTKAGASATITSGSVGDLNDLTSKVKEGMLYMPDAFKLEIQKQDWEGGDVILGLKEDASNILEHSRISIKNMVAGQMRATQKAAGGAPSAYLIEEIGKFDFLKGYIAAKPSFETTGKWKCIPILVGTGGEADLSGDAMQVLANPEAFNLLPMNWDLLESKIDPEFITWKRRNFATFVPAQMAYKGGFVKKDTPLSEFLGVKNKDLAKINIQVTNWERNKKIVEDKLESLKKYPLLYQQEKVQYPLDPEDCFVSTEGNPFPVKEAIAHRDRLRLEYGTHGSGKKVMLIRNPQTGKITAESAEEKSMPVYPHTGGFIDAACLMFMELPEERPPSYLFIAGYDDYKQESSDTTDSVGTLYIKMADVEGAGKFRNRIVFSIASRPDPHGKLHRQWALALEAFNARAFGENADADFKKYMDTQRKTDMYLVESMDFTSDLQITYGGKRKYGWIPNERNINFLFQAFVDYTKAEFNIELENGDIITVLGVELIDDIGLLDEIISYKKGNNVDRITAMMGAMGYEFQLHLNYMYPRMQSQEQIRMQQKVRKPELNMAQRMFKTPPKNNPYSR